MAVTTLTTVGFGEVHPLSNPGRAFVIVYLIVGLGVFSYGLVQLGETAVRTEMSYWLGKRRRSGMLKTMQNHYIICGFGRMGRTLCRQLADKRLPFVIVEKQEGTLAEAQQRDWPWIVGDASDDRTLREAGIERARGLASVLSSDADNLYVVLSARLLSKHLQIVSRASDETSVAKMEKAGANRVISLYSAGAVKMAQMLANPDLEDFIEIFTSHGSGLDLAEIHVTANGPYAGRTLGETDFRTRGIIIVGVRRANGELVLPASGSVMLAVDDELIALGKAEAISEISTS
jgi:voltage-gated potassium channel